MTSDGGNSSPFRRRRYVGEDGHRVDVYFEEEYESEYEELSVYDDDDDYTEVLIDDDGDILQSPVRSRRSIRSSKRSIGSPRKTHNANNKNGNVMKSPRRSQRSQRSSNMPSRKKEGSPLPYGNGSRRRSRRDMTNQSQNQPKSPKKSPARKPPAMPPLESPKRDRKNGFAAMVAAAASKRKDRVDSGGPLKVREAGTREDVPDEHRNIFLSVVEAAANMGRLVRLKEKVVEAESHRPEDVDKWDGPAGLKLDARSQAMIAIKEAAAVGQLKCRKPSEVTNYDPSDVVEVEEERINIDKDIDKRERAKFLLEHHFQDEKKEKKERWEDPASLDGKSYHSIDEVELPSENLPALGVRQMKFASRAEALQDLSTHVAAAAWDRKYRLQRPKAELKMTRGCQCPFCKNPNPFQTNKYKAMHLDKSEHIHGSEARRRKRQLEREMQKLYHPEEEEEEELKPSPPPPPPPPVVQSPPASTTEITIETSTDDTDSSFLCPPSTRSLGPRVLLDETIDFGATHKKVYIKRRKTRTKKEENESKDISRRSGTSNSTPGRSSSRRIQSSRKKDEGKRHSSRSSGKKTKSTRNRRRASENAGCTIM